MGELPCRSRPDRPCVPESQCGHFQLRNRSRSRGSELIWLTWRQQRFEAGLALAVLAVGVAVLLLTRQAITADINALGIPACLSGLGDNTKCLSAYQAFKDNFSTQQTLLGALTY